MFEIRKQFHFSAAHQLEGLPANHPCSRLHGHNYIVEIILRGERDERGFVLDYGDLKPISEWIDTKLDHKFICSTFHQWEARSVPQNEAYCIGATTSAENLAAHIFNEWIGAYPEPYQVRVSETPKTWATYPVRAVYIPYE